MARRIVALTLAVAFQAHGAQTQTVPATKETKVLFVDMQTAMQTSKQGAEAQKTVEAEEKKYGEAAQKAQQQMVQAKTELDQKASVMTPEARHKKERELNDMQRDFKNNVEDWKYEIQMTMQRETEAILKDIETAAKELGHKTGAHAIVDVQTGRALYVDPVVNGTDSLVAIMNGNFDAKQKAKTPTAATTTEQKK